MHFGDPFAGPIPDLDWSLDWRFDQMVRKLETNDLMAVARTVALQHFGAPEIDNLTREQKRVFVEDCMTAVRSARARKSTPA
ncbi:MAG: hypothetical protein CML67_18770 [Rhodobacteraceae bacterium]|nr:hypothetical protein [Paracoccaceae bacterium]